MRKHLAQDFDALYILDLGGNVRQNPKLSGTTHNVFGIQVGVSINLLVKKKRIDNKQAHVYYFKTDEYWRKEQKYQFLDEKGHYANIDWQEITPDKKHTWLTEGMIANFDTFPPMGTKEAKASSLGDTKTIFYMHGYGVQTNRDAWVCSFDKNSLIGNIERTIETYNIELNRWNLRQDPSVPLDDFVLYEESKIKWSSRLKECLRAGMTAQIDMNNVRNSLYRPFCRQQIYFDKIFVHRRGQSPSFFPTPETKNLVIGVSGISSNKPFQTLMTSILPIADMLEKTQCFPFYTYDEDGSNRRENITDWALQQFRAQYQDNGISKWDIFHYVYALLHHPHYREKYAANLKRELPRIPFAPEFRAFANAGQRLADLHVNYEQQSKFKLKFIEQKDEQLDWRVEKMKLSKDRTHIIYNHFLTLSGIPSEAFEYTFGNKSALHWIIDQYRVKTDKRSGIVNNPNREDEPDYIVNLIQRVITVSVKTVKIVKTLPTLEEVTPKD